MGRDFGRGNPIRSDSRVNGRSDNRSTDRSNNRNSDRSNNRSNNRSNTRSDSRSGSYGNRSSSGSRGPTTGNRFAQPKVYENKPLGESRLKGIYEESRGRRMQFLTKNFVPGQKVYTEKLINFNGVELREWIPDKSKLGAAVYNGISQIGINPGSKVLYIGAATGTTCSHVSDIIGETGELYALDFSPRTQRNLVFVTETRSNMTCLLEDAKRPEEYKEKVGEIDVIFQDIAQRDQAKIFIKNCNEILGPGGFGLLAVKSRSIDVKRNPADIFAEVKVELEEVFTIVDSRSLEPYEKDHFLFVIKKK
jgi:fibrillarin-like pre-rRNA processing protein